METTKPLCPYFGSCGGCAYQDMAYEAELSLKDKNLKQLLQRELDLADEILLPIVPSPEPYGYRSRLDLSFRRSPTGLRLGFNSEGTRRLVEIESCAIARPEISDFLPALGRIASEQLPGDYRSANLVVKTDDRGEVRWGGIGRGSLRLSESDYFWTEIEGKRIFYSLDTFFQANLGILPRFLQTLRTFLSLGPETHLLDLYAGVGLFWIIFAREVKAVWAVEESGSAMRLAEHNRRYHDYQNVFLHEGRTEDCLGEILARIAHEPQAAIADPPRQGLTPRARQALSQARSLNPLLYVSCNPEALVCDLKEFVKAGWKIDRVIPHDFFPRTRHLEVVVRLRARRG